MKTKNIIIAALIIAAVISLGALANLGYNSVGGIQGIETITLWMNGKTVPLDLKTERPTEDAENIRVGRVNYELRCAVCHGTMGDGRGSKAERLKTRPTDFTTGVFKFRSTKGAVPDNLDIFKTISRGLHGTGMLAWPGLTTTEKWQLTYYVKTFSDLFEGADKPEKVYIPSPIMSRPQYMKFGAEIYSKAKCYECHGHEGKGDGEKAGELKDDWQRPIKPANLKERGLKRGKDIDEIYLSIATGLAGTPMQSFAKSLKPDEMLALAYYVQSLSRVPTENGFITGILNMEDDERNGLFIDHVLMPTLYRVKYFGWMF
ncbi:MAG: cytochrome c [Nitrospinota bacterium]|nr:cytochrome c [Nitrospinota bacterium]